MVTCNQAELAHPALRAPHADVRPAFLKNYRLRQVAADVAMVVAVLAFVLAFVALRFTLGAPTDTFERIARVASGAAVVCLLALVGSLVLRQGGDAPNQQSGAAIPPPRTRG